MIQRFEIHGVHLQVDTRLQSYVGKKIGGLDKYISRRARPSAHGEVHLKELNGKDHNNSLCEVTLRLPHQTIIIKEHALNMYAAVDIAEVKLKQQLQKYKDLHGKAYRHRLARFRRQQAEA